MGDLSNLSFEDSDHCLRHLPIDGFEMVKRNGGRGCSEWMKVAVDVDVRLIHGADHQLPSEESEHVPNGKEWAYFCTNIKRENR